jgi:DNA-binding CsgD family transcriptional regulator
MFAIKRLLSRLGFKRGGFRSYALDDEAYYLLETLAEREQRPPEEVHVDVLANALEQQSAHDALLRYWDSLSPREKDVTALTCLCYTNRQIAARLHVSPDTVKGYIRQALSKFHLHSKDELRMVLRDWNFSDWGSAAPY